jgi:hypothetical protein
MAHRVACCCHRNLGGAGLTGTLPAEWSSLTSLHELRVAVLFLKPGLECR